jgi:chitodextrinase
VPSYYSGDIPSYDTWIAHNAPAGTIFCGFPGFRNDGQWYAGDNPAGGAGPLQTQTRQQAVVDLLARAHAKGYLCLPYIAMNGANAGTGFDGHYSDLNAVLGKIDLASSGSNFIAQPSFVDAWAKAKIVYWLCGVPNTNGMAAAARAQLYNQHNVGNIYLADQAPYFSRWASPAADPLLAEQIALAPIVSSGGGTPPPPPPLDTTAPVVSAIATVAGADPATTRTLTCTTDEAATVVVRYGTASGTYPLASDANATPTTSHSRALAGLVPGTTYHYVIDATDVTGNRSTSTDRTFATAAIVPPDTTPPAISAVAVTIPANTIAVVAWATNEPATSRVRYGTTAAYGSTTPLGDPGGVTTHTVTIIGLTPDTTYHFQVESGDPTGNVATSNDSTFTTTPPPAVVPPPDARSVTPDLIDAGSGSRTIMVTGVNFTATTVVRVNGAARATTYLDPTHVTAVLLAADTAALATLGIVVTDG